MKSHKFDEKFFTAIPNSVLNMILEERLQISDLLVYAYLLSTNGAQHYSMSSVQKIAEELKSSQSSIKRNLTRLSKAGVIRQERTIRFNKTHVLIRHISPKEERENRLDAFFGEN